MGRTRRWFAILSGGMLLLSLMVPPGALADSGGPFTRQLTGAGTATVRSAGDGSGAVQAPEFTGTTDADESPVVVSRSEARGHGAKQRSTLTPPVVSGNAVAGSNPGLNGSFDGLNFRQQRVANGSNQFSIEPPDQGLCAGNGFVLESVTTIAGATAADSGQ